MESLGKWLKRETSLGSGQDSRERAPDLDDRLQDHTDQRAKLKSTLMTELYTLWEVEKTHTTPCHPQANGAVKRNHRVLKNALQALLIQRGSSEWDALLPQLMQELGGTLHIVTDEKANLLMFGRELRLLNQLQRGPPPDASVLQNEYAISIQAPLADTHDLLRKQQMNIHQTDKKATPD
ncbi:uncharacterized protein [Watersipora subatra]|uniref:uncharacterized protein n=1 Tax=Watersipora subatra TaxID=2589382 RepID=UPI00355C1256